MGVGAHVKATFNLKIYLEILFLFTMGLGINNIKFSVVNTSRDALLCKPTCILIYKWINDSLTISTLT